MREILVSMLMNDYVKVNERLRLMNDAENNDKIRNILEIS